MPSGSTGSSSNGGNSNGPGDGSGDGGCDNLTTVTGTLTKDGICYFMDEMRLHVGPYWYLTLADAAQDYDGDGTTERLVDELDGLLGTQVTIDGSLHESTVTWLSFFYINEMLYREEGRPIWAGGHH